LGIRRGLAFCPSLLRSFEPRRAVATRAASFGESINRFRSDSDATMKTLEGAPENRIASFNDDTPLASLQEPRQTFDTLFKINYTKFFTLQKSCKIHLTLNLRHLRRSNRKA
jgi:hypothetical protein